MARIRSIHPGFFTDEHYVTVSPFARLLLIGLLTECDDNGAFEWKPVTLKMRLLPNDVVNVSDLLGELVDINAVARVGIDGRDIGLVRNFLRYQHPKKPNYRFNIPKEFRTYVGFEDNSSEPEPPEQTPVHQGVGEKREGRGRGREESSKTASPEQDAAREAAGTAAGDLVRKVVELFENANNPNPVSTSRISVWVERGYTEAEILAAVSEGLQKSTGAAVWSMGYFEGFLEKIRSGRERVPQPKPARSEADLARANLRFWFNSAPDRPHDRNWPGEFNDRWGGPPGTARCRIPADILAEFDVTPPPAPAPAGEQAA